MAMLKNHKSEPDQKRGDTRYPILLTLLTVGLSFLGSINAVQAVPGDLLGTVTLPGNGACSVAGTFTGTYYLTIQSGCGSITLQVYQPPVGGNGAAVLVSSKSIVDGAGDPVTISALAWDPSRGMVWGAFENDVFLIDIGDPTVSGDALATFQFNPNVGGLGLIDGLEWDPNDDTLYHSPDVDLNVYQFSLGTGGNPPLGTLLNTVAPKNADGVADGSVSGVEVGSGNTLYIGRNGFNEIRRVDKTTGDFVSTFATTAGRVEDLTCDPVTYAPNEAILAKDAFNGLYEAFEVEPGTCPLDGAVVLDHFKCYSAKGEGKKGIDQSVHLRDQFGEEVARVGKPKLFCNPVDKNGEGILHPEAHLTCYEIRSNQKPRRRDVLVENQFGAQTLKLKGSKLLCVPSTKTVVDTK